MCWIFPPLYIRSVTCPIPIVWSLLVLMTGIKQQRILTNLYQLRFEENLLMLMITNNVEFDSAQKCCSYIYGPMAHVLCGVDKPSNCETVQPLPPLTVVLHYTG
jgi:hypothetical protein